MIYYKIAKWYKSYPLLQASNDLSRAQIKHPTLTGFRGALWGFLTTLVYLNCITLYTLYYSPNCYGYK